MNLRLFLLMSMGIVESATFIFSPLCTAKDMSKKTLPLTTLESRLPASAEEGRKAIDTQSFGVVTINERTLALPVDVESPSNKSLSIHSDVYDYYFVPVTIGVAGLDGAELKSFIVEIAVPDRRVAANDAWLVDVFPKLEVSKGRLSAGTEIEVSGDLSLSAALPDSIIASAAAKVGGKSRLKWDYNPVFQSFTAVFSESTAIWSFDKVADELKAGPIELRLLIAVRKDGRVSEKRKLRLLSRIRAEFSGGLFTGRYASTSASVNAEF